PDGNVWFTESSSKKIGRITPTGTITELSVQGVAASPADTAAGPGRNPWFTEAGVGEKIGRLTPTGTLTEFPLPTDANTGGITVGPDGNLWFTDTGTYSVVLITPAGVVTEFGVTVSLGILGGIPAGPDGNIWFTNTRYTQICYIKP